MSQIPAIGLVVVGEGTVSVFAPDHVDLRIVFLSDIRDGRTPVLPMGVGFEELADKAGLRGSVNFWLEDGKEHSMYPKGEWRTEVLAGETELGYVEWVRHQIIRQEIGAVDGGE